jgi:RNA polymerase sigma factor (sigma-70 family)
LRGRVRTAENAEDVLHDFCLKVVTHSCEIQRSEAVGSWMTQVLRRTLVDHYRRSSAGRRCADVLASNASGFATEKHETQASICPYLQVALPAIKQEYVDLIRRIDFLGERRCDVAENLAISVNALTVRLLRARRTLRKRLLRFCETFAIVTAQLAVGRDRISD